MEIKDVLSFLFFLFIVALLFLYWFLPLGKTEFMISNSVSHSNFTLNISTEKKMQFYDNMRYPNNKISYKIEKCSLGKKDEILRAIWIIEEKTILDFYSVKFGEEIKITCDDKEKFDGSFFVAGEGGPIKITQSKNFNVIHNGGVTLIRESKCSEPVVPLHEILHALGFDHSENPKNIMYPISRCDQKISEDIIQTINYLYSFPSYPDLSLENVSASMKGRYLDLNFTVKNEGLKDSNKADLIIYLDGREVKRIVLDPIQIGWGLTITLKNILVLQPNLDKIELFIDYNSDELDKQNNKIILEAEQTK